MPGLIFPQYVATAPSLQNAVDAVPGWTTSLPMHLGVAAGAMALTVDPRVSWVIERLGPLDRRTVLELGPLDGGHTAMLHAAGAAVSAVEANRNAFLRCLVTKELLGLDRARFYLGDFTQGLGPAEGRYDLVMAAGVLYHVSDPVALLAMIAGRADAVYLWTHVVDREAMPAGDPRRGAFTGRTRRLRGHGGWVTLHERRYHGAHRAASFCGGPRDAHVWMERADLLAELDALGFSEIDIAHEQPDAAAGPALSILARRRLLDAPDGRAASGAAP